MAANLDSQFLLLAVTHHFSMAKGHVLQESVFQYKSVVPLEMQYSESTEFLEENRSGKIRLPVRECRSQHRGSFGNELM